MRPGVNELAAWLADVDELRLAAWPDGNGDGHPASSHYAETFWLPLVGPTSLWVLRRLVARRPGAVVRLDELAAEMGVGPVTSKHSPIVRATARLAMFDFARVVGDELAVRASLPHLTIRQETHLPTHLQRVHVLLPRPGELRARATAPR